MIKSFSFLQALGLIACTHIDQSPAILTSNDFIRSNEILGKKWPIYVVIGHFVITI